MKMVVGLALLAVTAGPALAGPRPVVVELFTSQGCSDCPPADALLRKLKARDPDILALDLHVTYWNSAAWSDPFSLASATARQNWYAGLRHTTEIYTPQAVVDGHMQFVGSNRRAMAAAISQARSRIAASHPVPVSVGANGNSLAVRVGAGKDQGTVWLFGYDPMHSTKVRGGENGGELLREVNVVRSITKLGQWHGQAMVLNVARPQGAQFAVLVQQDDGAILGASDGDPLGWIMKP